MKLDQEALLQRASAQAQTLLREPLWFKDAVIYQLHVKAFRDSNGDGIGDFKGLTESLGYIRDLGVNTLWLLPFYPSPQRDDGYDIADYHNVHPSHGTKGDFRRFIREAHHLGLRVITELVINHTSDQHPWFQAARRAPPGSVKRDYYVWSDDASKWKDTRIIFTDTETSNWAWDDMAKAFYWHRFFAHQPDLNFANPHVIQAVVRVMHYWFEMGVDGMRLDAIPYLCERDGTNNENLPETHAVLKYMRAALDRRYPDRFFLAEVNQWPEDVREYFGNGDECHMAYHFPLMPRMYMAVASEDRQPIIDIMAQTPEIPDNCQWAVFLRNHDELTLEMVTERERSYMYDTYARDRRMRINVGIRRRLAPLMDNDRRRIELLNSLLMSILGSPVIYYGDEIGMGDNVYLGDRNGVRTPMQWSPDRNGGFSRADPQTLYASPVMDPVYGYQSVNVEAQARSTSSLLAWMKRLIAVRKSHAALSRGTLRFVRPGNRKVLAYIREYGGEVLLCVANLARSSQPVELDLREFKGRTPVELLGDTSFPPIGELPYLLTLPGWGFYWFVLSTSAPHPDWHDERPVPPEPPVLVIPNGILEILHADKAGNEIRALMLRRGRQQLEQEALPAFLAAQRWFAGKSNPICAIRLVAEDELGDDGARWLLATLETTFDNGMRHVYALPLALAWEDADFDRVQSLRHATVSRVRQRAKMGIVYDAYWDDGYCRRIVEGMRRAETVQLKTGVLVFSRTSAFADAVDEAAVAAGTLAVAHPAFEQSNSLVVLGQKLVLKGYRRLRRGINAEIEMGRFLTEISPFPHIAPVLGALEHHNPAGEAVALAVLQTFVDNEGSGWTHVTDYLGRHLDDVLALPADVAALPGGEPSAPPATSVASVHAAFLARIDTLGARTAELHRALAVRTGDPAFDPEAATADDVEAWIGVVRRDVVATLDHLARQRDALPAAMADQIDAVLGAREALLAHLANFTASGQLGARIRVHGDYHLGQVLVTGQDYVIVDFEGEPGRSIGERRHKHSPLRDVAGMVRSFSYAAAFAFDKATAQRQHDQVRVVPPLAAWRQATVGTFLAAYSARMQGCVAHPGNDATMQALLRLFVLEKTLYELRYELDNRIDWVRIPLAGLTQQLLELERR
jgi:maltose alpha-D-glucosyltransferase/alpha-amylase